MLGCFGGTALKTMETVSMRGEINPSRYAVMASSFQASKPNKISRRTVWVHAGLCLHLESPVLAVQLLAPASTININACPRLVQ